MKRHLSYFALLFALTVSALPADVIYNVSVTTAGYQGQPGYLDFQLGRGPDSETAIVAVGNFSSNGVLSGSVDRAGAVTGTLPGAVTLTNATQFNDYFQGFTYASTVSFVLTFGGPAINAPSGSAAYGSPFYFGLYDASQSPLGANDGLGNALLIQINPNGTTTSQSYNSAVTVTNAAAIPEPAPWGLVVVGLLLSVGVTRRLIFSGSGN